MSSEYIVHPSHIESQLTTIWDQLQGIGKTRASLFNLIIYTSKNSRINYLYQIAQKLIEKFPSRVIFVTVDETAPPDTLKTSVSVISSESPHNSIACDLINIMLSMQNKERAPFMILPHLLTDLPIYLLWGDDPSKNDPLTQKLEKLASRVIFDSESTDHLVAFAKAALNHKSLSGSDIADLNWARTEGWRQLLAETFRTGDKLQLLKTPKIATIYYNCLETEFFCHTKIQALYFQAWVAAQMGWQLASASLKGKETHFTYTYDKANIPLILAPKSIEGVGPGRILEVQIESQDGSLFHLARSEKQSHIIHIHYSTPHFCQLPLQFVLDRYESGQSLVKEIFHKGTSRHYLSVIQTVSNITSENAKAYG